MSEKLKALINSVFIQLNRYEKQQPDFSAESFCASVNRTMPNWIDLIFRARSAIWWMSTLSYASTLFRVRRNH